MRAPSTIILALAALILLLPGASAAGTLSLDHSTHEGIVVGDGTLAALKFINIKGGSATLTFESAHLEQEWANNTLNGPTLIEFSRNSGRDDSYFDRGAAHMITTQGDALLMVFPDDEVEWDLDATSGRLDPVEAIEANVRDENPVARTGEVFETSVADATRWSSESRETHVLRGDFRLSVFGWNIQFDDGRSYETGTSPSVERSDGTMDDLEAAFIHLKGATLTVETLDGLERSAYITAPTLTTDGITTLVGDLGGSDSMYEGVTTLTATNAGDALEATLTEGYPQEVTPSTQVALAPEAAWWLWGSVGGAVAVAAGFVVLLLMTRNVPMLEWRSYHALDQYRPRTASFWASFWTRRDPWEGHAWSARGEARMLLGQDRGAARDFTRAHTLLPVEERAVNALHAARAHARLGEASQTAHWIGIVANLDVNVLLSAREEPDFARVWSEPAVQRTIQQVLGVGA